MKLYKAEGSIENTAASIKKFNVDELRCGAVNWNVVDKPCSTSRPPKTKLLVISSGYKEYWTKAIYSRQVLSAKNFYVFKCVESS
jgi:hypothetical protein